MICGNCKEIEKILIKIFKNMFIQKRDIGTEYFEGEYEKMIDIIYSTIRSKNSGVDEDVNKIIENKPLIMEPSVIQIVKCEEYQKKAFEKVCEPFKIS
jgi:hypothetical protein